jgi:carboxypeptidase C (cathepsin A)
MPGSNQGWMSPVPNTLPDLTLAIKTNPGLHVLVLQGFYDLATPFLATKLDLEHLNLTAEERKRIHMDFFEAGHMMYVHEPSLKRFRSDVVEFVRATDRL